MNQIRRAAGQPKKSATSIPCSRLTLIKLTIELINKPNIIFQVVRTLVSPANAAQVIGPAQKAAASCGVLPELCTLLMTAGVPADILAEVICTVGECIRGCRPNQEAFGRVMASSPGSPPRSALVVLLMSMVNEKQPTSLRTAVLYCFECFVHKNDAGQSQIVQALLPTSAEGGNNLRNLIC